MDWSELYPDLFPGDPSEKDAPRVEFADIGCGYGGLLGAFRFTDLTIPHRSCSSAPDLIAIMSPSVFFKWSCLHFSQTNWCWAWRSESKCLITFGTVSSHCGPWKQGATRTSPVFVAMQWSTSLTSFPKGRYVCAVVFNIGMLDSISDKESLYLRTLHYPAPFIDTRT